MLATLLPPLAAVAFVDMFPLQPVELGLEHSTMIWVRGFFVGAIEAYALSGQFRHYIPELQISRWALILTATAASIVIHGIVLCLVILLWYPLPFTLLWLSGPWIVILALALKFFRGNYLREHAEVQHKVRRLSLITVAQTSTILVYTTLNVLFVRVPIKWQPFVALFVPIFKITQKNVLCRILLGNDDVKPEMVIFNVEISNAFFISSNMQREASINTSILLILLDMVQMLVSLCDLNLMIKSMERVTEKLKLSTDNAVTAAVTIATKSPELWRQQRSATGNRLLQSKAALLIMPSFRRLSLSSISGASLASTVRVVPMKAGTSRILPIECSAKIPHLNDRATVQEQGLLLEKVLQIMFFTEFVLLTEFIEVFTPVLYSKCTQLRLGYLDILLTCFAGFYLIVLFWWPNRKFYPQFDGLDEAQFWKNIRNTLMYGLMEMGSFALLIFMIYRTTHKHPLQQLAYTH
ncbi:unnamed protein product [Phytophthora fragariaefolia]|uniref:Unnamed protein product n=1 Tax=Phytophthora fragariaefolia TaxID=1490495 RepID=A0A9W6U7I1_9STRA|nr:unnamed protein product [Phytophthora fragariaefolia]